VRVKFCGITNLDDAAEAVRLGAWAVGLIHFHGSPRDVDRAVAAEIAAAFRRKCEVVGVFVNPTLEEVTRAVEDEGLTMVQLNGAEAFRTDFHLFDRRARGAWGGTGESFDWELLRGHRSEIPAMLAGGLRPENVATAISITHPHAVDVASGVELEPGRKDHAAMAAFFEAANPVGAEA